MKYDISVFFENLSRILKFYLKMTGKQALYITAMYIYKNISVTSS